MVKKLAQSQTLKSGTEANGHQPELNRNQWELNGTRWKLTGLDGTHQQSAEPNGKIPVWRGEMAKKKVKFWGLTAAGTETNRTQPELNGAQWELNETQRKSTELNGSQRNSTERLQIEEN